VKSHRPLRGTAPVLSRVALASLACSLALTGAAQAGKVAPKAAKRPDTIPPTFTFSVAPLANVQGWNNTNVTITVRAADNPGGSGVAFIKDTITNAGAAVPGTTVNGTSATLVISSEGVNVVKLLVQDVAGNRAERTLTVRIHKTPPVPAKSGTGIYGPGAFVLGSPFKSGSFTTNKTSVRVHFGLRPDPITGASTITTVKAWLERAVDHANLGTIAFDPLDLDYSLDLLSLNKWSRGSYQLLIHLDDGSIHPITLTLTN